MPKGLTVLEAHGSSLSVRVMTSAKVFSCLALCELL